MAAFSIGSWSFHELFEAGKMNLFGYLESLKYRYHLRDADIWSEMILSVEDDYIQLLKHTLEEEDISLACLASDGTGIWHRDPEIREQHHQLALRYLDIATTLGAHMLRIDPGSTGAELTEEEFDFVVNRYREYAHIARERGFYVGPQTHQPAVQVPTNVKRLYDAISSDAFGIVLDVDRWLVDESVGDEMCAPYARHVHFDSSRTKSSNELEGKVAILQKAGYSGCWALEYRLGSSEYLGVAVDLAELKRAVWNSAR